MRALILAAGLAWGEGPGPVQETPPPPPVEGPRAAAGTPAQIQEMYRRELEALKKKDPAAYERRMAFEKRQKTVAETIVKAHKGELSRDEARRILRPLIKEDVAEEKKRAPERIAALEKRLEFLRRAQKDENAFYEQRLDELLGKPSLPPEALSW